MPFERLAFALEPEHELAFQPSARARYVQIVSDRARLLTGALVRRTGSDCCHRERLPPILAIAVGVGARRRMAVIADRGLATGVFALYDRLLWPAIVVAAVFIFGVLGQEQSG